MTRSGLMKVSLVEVVLSGAAQGLSDDVVIHPIAAATLAAYVTASPELVAHVEVEVLVVNVDERPEEYIPALGLDQSDVVGFTTYTWNDLHIRHAAETLSSIHPNAMVLLGGPQAGHAPSAYVGQVRGVDAVVTGPGEEPFRRILHAMLEGRGFEDIPGVTYLSNGRLRFVPGKLEDDLTRIPSPFQTGFVDLSGEGPHAVYVETFRGCVHRCGFCLWGVGRKGIDAFPLDQVLADVRLIYSTPNVANVYFVDAYLFYVPARAQAIIEEIERAPYQHPTFFEFDPRHVRREHIEQVKEVCGHDYRLGIQSFDLNVLSEAGRRQRDIDDIRGKIELIREVDRKALVSFALIYGLPGDSLKGFRETLSEAIRLDADSLKINVLSVLRGTPYWDERLKYGLDFESDPPHRLLASNDFSAEDLLECARLAMWVVFLLGHEVVKLLFRLAVSSGDSLDPMEIMDALIEVLRNDLPDIDRLSRRDGLSVEDESRNRLTVLKLRSDPDVEHTVSVAALKVFGLMVSGLPAGYEDQAMSLTAETIGCERAWQR